jgi:murein DD-endopeptidase MepM/ murein hydrolase activator NlpD
MKKLIQLCLVLLLCFSSGVVSSSSYPFKIRLSSEKVKQGHAFACFIVSHKKIKSAHILFEGKKHYFHSINRNKILRVFTGIDVAHPTGRYNIYYTVNTSDNKIYNIKGKIEIIPHVFMQKTFDGRAFKPKVKLNRQMIEILKDRDTLLKERKIVVKILNTVSDKMLWRGKFIYPTTWLTYRIKKVNGRQIKTPREKPTFGVMRVSLTQNGKHIRYHRGTDYVNFAWTKVFASQRGRVVLSRLLKASGNTVIIDHGQGVFTFYCHLIRTYPKEGMIVKKGAVIGRIGSTGLSTGAHLHFEVRVGGVSVTPTQWYNYAFALPIYY